MSGGHSALVETWPLLVASAEERSENAWEKGVGHLDTVIIPLLLVLELRKVQKRRGAGQSGA